MYEYVEDEVDVRNDFSPMEAEAEAQARWAAEQQARAAERLARAEAEARRAAEKQTMLLLEKLRLRGIDPEQL